MLINIYWHMNCGTTRPGKRPRNMIVHFVLKLPHGAVGSVESNQGSQANKSGEKGCEDMMAYPVAVNRFAATAFILRCKAVQGPPRR